MSDLNNVVAQFKNDPYEFESYCVKLYQLMGIDAKSIKMNAIFCGKGMK